MPDMFSGRTIPQQYAPVSKTYGTQQFPEGSEEGSYSRERQREDREAREKRESTEGEEKAV